MFEFRSISRKSLSTVFRKVSYRSGLTPMLILKTILIQVTALIKQMNQILTHIVNSQLKTGKYHFRIVLRNHQVSGFLEKKVTYRSKNIKYVLVYSTWGSYSECSTTCGNGEKTRSRTCIGGICSLATSSDLIQTDICNEGDCKSYQSSISDSLHNNS